jgi:hypothetical protein
VQVKNRHEYPPDWEDISLVRREQAGWVCEWCGAAQGQPHPITGSRVVLTVAHLNHTKMDCTVGNLAALCQRCHLNHDRPRHIANRKRNRRLRLVGAGQGEMEL